MNHTAALPDLREYKQKVSHYLDRAFSGIALVAVHEVGTLRGHWADVDIRLKVARRARGAGELIRDQIDLLPESRNRVLRDQRVRRELWRGAVKDFYVQDVRYVGGRMHAQEPIDVQDVRYLRGGIDAMNGDTAQPGENRT